MKPLVPQVHLFICFDDRVKPGVVLQSLDIVRANHWQNETILVCDESWRPYVNIDQPIVFVSKDSMESFTDPKKDSSVFDEVLDQLDNFEIVEVTQIGELNWGRWLVSYFDHEPEIAKNKIVWEEKQINSIQIMNDISRELSFDSTSPTSGTIKSQAVYVDPYEGDNLSESFLALLPNLDAAHWPVWLQIIVNQKDRKYLEGFGLHENLVDLSDSEMSLFNQSVLCFSGDSKLAQTSRSYNVAVLGADHKQALFLPGDISIQFSEPAHPLELFNVLSYWKANRLRELAFQWVNMGIEIQLIESFHGRIAIRNLLNYSNDLFHAQNLVSEFVNCKGEIKPYKVRELVSQLRDEFNNDPYTLSFSLKLLMMIVDRMIASAKCGERLFQRLGSDYHRIIIGESLIEGLIEKNAKNLKDMDLPGQLTQFKNFLVQVDLFNDENDLFVRNRESR